MELGRCSMTICGHTVEVTIPEICPICGYQTFCYLPENEKLMGQGCFKTLSSYSNLSVVHVIALQWPCPQ